MAITAELARIGGDGAFLAMGDSITSLATATFNTAYVIADSNFTTVAEVNSVNPSQEVAEVDVTSLNSGILRKYKPGHLSATLSANVHFAQDTGTSKDALDLLNSAQARETRAWRLQLPVDSGTNTGTNTEFSLGFLGFITNISPTVTDDDEPMAADVTFRVSDSTYVDAIG